YVDEAGPVWLLLHEGSIRVCNTRDQCQTLDNPCRLLRIGANGDLQDPGTWNALPQTREVNFEAAFPFVVNPPSIDATPIFTRADIELGRCPEPKVRKAEEPTPKVHKAEKSEPRVKRKPRKKYVYSRPRRQPKYSQPGFSISIGIGGGGGGGGGRPGGGKHQQFTYAPARLLGRLADNAVYEGELGRRYFRDDERIEVLVSHAAIDVVKRQRQRHPAFDERVEGLGAIDVEGTQRPSAAPAETSRARLDPMHRRRIERIEHVQIVRPRLGPVFPWMRAGVG